MNAVVKIFFMKSQTTAQVRKSKMLLTMLRRFAVIFWRVLYVYVCYDIIDVYDIIMYVNCYQINSTI